MFDDFLLKHVIFPDISAKKFSKSIKR